MTSRCIDVEREKNLFSLGSQIGGPKASEATRQDEQELRDLINQWSAKYTDAVREFAFLLRVDGEIHRYTEKWKIVGAQPAKRKGNWIEVEIGIPEAWYRRGDYRGSLATEIEKGLQSMINLLQRNRHTIRAEALMEDWKKIKAAYLR